MKTQPHPAERGQHFRPTYVPQQQTKAHRHDSRAKARQMVRIPAFEIPTQVAPAFRSAIEEISNEVGGRLEGSFPFAAEQALTDAMVALGQFRAIVCASIPAGDPHYRTR